MPVLQANRIRAIPSAKLHPKPVFVSPARILPAGYRCLWPCEPLLQMNNPKSGHQFARLCPQRDRIAVVVRLLPVDRHLPTCLPRGTRLGAAVRPNLPILQFLRLYFQVARPDKTRRGKNVPRMQAG